LESRESEEVWIGGQKEKYNKATTDSTLASGTCKKMRLLKEKEMRQQQ